MTTVQIDLLLPLRAASCSEAVMETSKTWGYREKIVELNSSTVQWSKITKFII
jgi:hypothetical protein